MQKYTIWQDAAGYWRAGTEWNGRFRFLDAPRMREKILIIQYLLAISRGAFEMEEREDIDDNLPG